MEIRKIKKLIELLEQSNITEIEIKEGDQSIRLSRQGYIPETRFQNESKATHYETIATKHTQSVTDSPKVESVVTAPSFNTDHAIRSPMVGTLYLAASPESPPFVSLGQKVNAGDTLCVIEAMKMFNEIEADKTGTITEILIKNGDPVEYDQPLFMIQE